MLCMEKGFKQFDKYLTAEDLLGCSSFVITEEEEDGLEIPKR